MLITITVESTISSDIEKVWKLWTEPNHIKNWYYASDDWYAPNAENDLKVDGRFKISMSAKDKAAGFDFSGTYTAIVPLHLIDYTLDDGRKAVATFTKDGDTVKVTQTFEPENENTHELQKNGWQSILNNFKKYVEAQK